MNEEYDEDIIIELESYLDSIKKEVEDFKKISDVTHIKIKEVRYFYLFLIVYIELEDKILSHLLQMKADNYQNGEEFIDKFLPYWSEFQNEWNEELWDYYNFLRGFDKKELMENKTRENNNLDEENNNKIKFVNKGNFLLISFN